LTLQIKGQGKKGLLVICQDSDLKEEQETLLKNIITAIKYDYQSDIFVATIAQNTKVLINEANIAYQKAIVFGLKPNQIGLNIEYVPNHLLSIGECDLIFAQTLTEINGNPTLKSALWKNLQLMIQ
jgi:hypothetical protein